MPSRLLALVAAAALAAVGAVPAWRAENEPLDITASMTAAQRRIAHKGHVAADLIDDRISVREAAARVLDVLRDDPGGRTVLRVHVPGTSDEERAARNVVGFAVSTAEDRPDGAAVRERLECELEAFVAGLDE